MKAGAQAGQRLAGLVIVGNLLVRLPGLNCQGEALGAASLLLLPVLSLVFPGLLSTGRLLFGVGFSLPLFGYQAYLVQNQFFEYLVAVTALVLWLRPREEAQRPLSGSLFFLLLCYVVLAAASLLVLPAGEFVRLAHLWGMADFFSAVLAATPENPLSSLAAVNRLLLFLCFVFLLLRQRSGEAYAPLFSGVGMGCLVAAVLGLANQYGLVDLSRLRPQFVDPSGVARLHSVMGNPGWFAQFFVAALPVALLWPFRKRSWFMRLAWFSGVVLVGGWTLLLTGSRSSWLIFPLVIGCCLVVLVRQRPVSGGTARGGWRPAGAGAVFLVVVALVLAGTLGPLPHGNESPGQGVRSRYLAHRLQQIFELGERGRIWKETMILAGESPVVGLGYGSYKWHQQVMASIPQSRFARNRSARNDWDTPHSFYLQVLVENGLVGAGLMLLLLAGAGTVLYRQGRGDPDGLAWICLVSLLMLLCYGLSQSLQYIPVVWFLFWLFLGRALVPVTGEAGGRGVPVPRFFLFLCGGVCLLAGCVYVTHFEAVNLAGRYGLNRYALDRTSLRYQGFHAAEQWAGQGEYRWSGRRGVVDFQRDGRVRLFFACHAPDLGNFPLTMDVLVNGVPVRRHTFWSPQKVALELFLPRPGSRMEVRVSRTWNLKRSGLGRDSRSLGVAVSRPVYLDTASARDLGLLGWQVARDSAGAGERLFRYQWLGPEAMLAGDRNQVLLRAWRPGLAEVPLRVILSRQGGEEKEVLLASTAWTRVALERSAGNGRPLRIRVSRTWNPKLDGYGSDPRDLGVAVAFAEEGMEETGQRTDAETE